MIVYGNHDAASEITRRLRPPDNVPVFSHAQPETVLLDDAGLAFHGQSYARRPVTEDLSAACPDRTPGYLNVGVLHTCLDGRPGHEPYALCWRLDLGNSDDTLARAAIGLPRIPRETLNQAATAFERGLLTVEQVADVLEAEPALIPCEFDRRGVLQGQSAPDY